MLYGKSNIYPKPGIVSYLEDAQILDDTVIVFLSDNGASAEGGVDGRFNAMRGQDVTVSSEGEAEYAYEHLDEIGTELSFNHYISSHLQESV